MTLPKNVVITDLASQTESLLFKVAEFLPDGCVIGHADGCPTIKFVEHANRILREKLEKAPICTWKELNNSEGWCEYTARLIYIKPVGSVAPITSQKEKE